jgi:hypothetical protein
VLLIPTGVARTSGVSADAPLAAPLEDARPGFAAGDSLEQLVRAHAVATHKSSVNFRMDIPDEPPSHTWADRYVFVCRMQIDEWLTKAQLHGHWPGRPSVAAAYGGGPHSDHYL